MKCKNCKGEWISPPTITVTECPFCKMPIEPTKTLKTYESAKDALHFIMQTYGAEALLTKNLFSDIAPNLSDERELIKMFREKGALDILKGALKSSGPEQSIAVKRAIGKLPLYLQSSKEAISLLNDFATELGWNVLQPSVTKSILPQIIPSAQPSQATNPQSSNVLEVGLKVGSIIHFGKYDWRVLDVQKGQALLLSNEIIEKKKYHLSMTATTWAECELRSYLNGTFYNSFGQEKSRIVEAHNNNSNNFWYNTRGGSETTDRIFLLSLEEVDKYFGNSGDYKNKNRKSNAYINNNYDQLRIAKDSRREACMWYLRSPGSISSFAAAVLKDGTVSVFGGNVDSLHHGVRPALWLNL